MELACGGPDTNRKENGSKQLVHIKSKDFFLNNKRTNKQNRKNRRYS